MPVLPKVLILCLVMLPAAAARADAVTVKVANPLPAARAAETIAVSLAEIRRLGPALEPRKLVVLDAARKPVLSQLVDVDGDETPDELVFQTELAARESKLFSLEAGERLPPAPEAFRVYGRFVRERHDDFAWENDRVAHRMYGPDLETWRREPLTSSGIDVWTKRVRKLVVNDWYMTDDYHRDHGEGADMYSVGKSRGCGGLGLWTGDKLAVSRNFVSSRVLANGPLRLVFELGYAPFDAGGMKIAETKRFTVDAGANFDRIESTFKVDGPARPLAVAVGIAKHEGGAAELGGKGTWLRSWEPLKPDGGHLGCAVVLPPGATGTYKPIDTDHLIVVEARPGTPFVAYAGFGWDRGGDGAAPDLAGWTATVERRARELVAPVRVSLSAASSAPSGTRPPPATPASGGGGLHWAARVSDAVMQRSPGLTDKWSYDAGLVLSGMESVWRATGDAKLLEYLKAVIDRFVDADGGIKGYDLATYNLDEINMGKVLFGLYAGARDPGDKERYRKALVLLRSQLQTQPRTADGGFWHKQIYPHQMWLDGVYMASPFLARYANVFGEPAALAEAAQQIRLAERHLRDPKSGLLRHGWDEQKASRWADPTTGCSSQFWGRGMGWYAMAVVDVLAEMPKGHPDRAAVLDVLRRLATAIASVQDPVTGVWWQVLDAGARPGNYREASASAMFVYALSKGVKNGWLDGKRFGPVAALGWAGVLNQFVVEDGSGLPSLTNICKVAGLGGTPYRDGSFDYYAGTERAADDPKGVGAFILAGAARN